MLHLESLLLKNFLIHENFQLHIESQKYIPLKSYVIILQVSKQSVREAITIGHTASDSFINCHAHRDGLVFLFFHLYCWFSQ